MSGREPPRGLREIVLVAIGRSGDGRTFLRDVLAREFEKRDFPLRLRGAATELAAGILRRRLTLDHLIAQFTDRAIRRIDPGLLDVLRLAVYEILFVAHVPVHASVSEAVTLVRTHVREAFAPFANAVLRALTRAVVGEEPSTVPSARALPIGHGLVVRFDRDVLPDPVGDLTGYLSVTGGVPRWLVARWQRNFATDVVFQIVAASASKPPLTVRVNTLRATRDALADELARSDVTTSPGDVAETLRIDSPVALTSLDAFREGRFYIQDVSALSASRLVDPRPGERVLDLCAAPGGKTTHLAELAADRAEITALDVSTRRLERVVENVRRLGITCIRTRSADARRLPDDLKGTFDAVLADVPCSNTGVLRRRVEARHRLTPESINERAGVQREILRAALGASRPDGRVVYSTCSIEPEENRDVVRRVLDETPGWRLDLDEEQLPRADGADGGYAARLVPC